MQFAVAKLSYRRDHLLELSPQTFLFSSTFKAVSGPWQLDLTSWEASTQAGLRMQLGA